jgi:hypothetical protein
MKKTILTIFIISLFTTFSYSQEKFARIEKLTFNGFYNWGFIWMRAGVVEFNIKDSDKYRDAIEIKAVGSSLPSWDWVFRLRDTLTSHFNPHTFYPYESSRKAHEGSYHKTFDYIWDYSQKKVFANIEKIDKYKRKDTIDLQPDTYDMISIAWKVRELDYDKFVPDEKIPIKILLDDKIYDIYVRYHGTETIKINRKKRECYVFSPMLVEGDVFKKGENMKVWVSKDSQRLPLMVEAKILVGSIKGIIDMSETTVIN